MLPPDTKFRINIIIITFVILNYGFTGNSFVPAVRLRQGPGSSPDRGVRYLLEGRLAAVLGVSRAGESPGVRVHDMSSTSSKVGLTDHSKGGHVLMDKDGLVKYDGDIIWWDEFFECAKGYFYSLKDDDRKYACTRVKAQLFGNAKDLTYLYQMEAVSYENLEKLAKTEPFKALELLAKQVKASCSPAVVITQSQAFNSYFKTANNRKWGEEVVNFKQRRDGELTKLTTLNPGTTLSQNLVNYFMMDRLGISEAEHMAVLRDVGNKYDDTAAILEILKVQHHEIGAKELSGQRQRPRKKVAPPGIQKKSDHPMGRGKGGGTGGYGKGQQQWRKAPPPGQWPQRNYLQDMPSDDEEEYYDANETYHQDEQREEEEEEPGDGSTGAPPAVYWADSDDEKEKPKESGGCCRMEALKEFENFLVRVDMASLQDRVASKVASAVQDIYATFGKKRDDLSAKAAQQNGFSGKFSATRNLKFPNNQQMSNKFQALKQRTH